MKRKGIEKEEKSSKKLVTVAIAAMTVMAVMTAFMASAAPDVDIFTIEPEKGITNAVSSYNATINTTGFSSLDITIPAGFGAVAPTAAGVQIAKVDLYNASGWYANITIVANASEPTTKVDMIAWVVTDPAPGESKGIDVNYAPGATTTIDSPFDGTASATLKLPTSSATGYLSFSLPASIGLTDARVEINQSVENPADEGDYDFVAKADGETTGKVATVHIAPVSFAITIEPNFGTERANLTANASEALDDEPTVSIKRDTETVPWNKTSWGPNNITWKGNFSIATNGTYVINVSGDAAGNFGYGIARLNVTYTTIPGNESTEIPLPEEMKMSVNITTNATKTGGITVTRTNESEISTPPDKTPIGFISIEAEDEIKNKITNVTINITYTDAEIEGINESTLRIYYYNGTAWEALEQPKYDGGVNELGNYVWGNITHLTEFGVMGSPVYGVELEANRYTAFTKPAENATYILTVTNTGNSTDSFTLEVVDNPDGATTANLSTYTLLDVAAGNSRELRLNVTNATVTNGEPFRVNVTVNSTKDPSKVDYINTTTNVTTKLRTVPLVYNTNNYGRNFISWTGNETNASSLVTLINTSVGIEGCLPYLSSISYYNTTEGSWKGFIVGFDIPGTAEDFAIPQYTALFIRVGPLAGPTGSFQMPVAPYT